MSKWRRAGGPALQSKCSKRPGVRLPELGGPWPPATPTLHIGNSAERKEVTHPRAKRSRSFLPLCLLTEASTLE